MSNNKLLSDVMRKPKAVLSILFLLFLIKGFYYSLFIPPWEAPDEPGHVDYVLNLYQNKEFPGVETNHRRSHSEDTSFVYQRKYVLPAVQRGMQHSYKELFTRTNFTPGKVIQNIAGNPPLYYIYLLPFYAFSLMLPSYWSLVL